MARVTRRKFLKASGAGALAAKTGGMAGILAASKAPAYAQATTVHWLKWTTSFRPATRFCANRCWRKPRRRLASRSTSRRSASMTSRRVRRRRSRPVPGPTSS